MVQCAFFCTLKKGYARNVCAVANNDTFKCLTCIFTFPLATQQVPMVVSRRPKRLKDILLHSELKTPGAIKGCVKCRDRRCRVCYSLLEDTCFKSMVTGNNL